MTRRNSKDDPARENDRIPRGLLVRLFVYLVAGHLFAAFLWLLFEVGASRQ
ncbi:DUF6126 family protein [Streptomyces nanshensis]|uniref:DUF6126 family protein n=1 Tax=Streptomyces nanshensis TaxID=518642 RepID=UPI000A4A8A6E|nr:DUF6126 family protein [Streptomyces nanshensis]